MLRGILIILFGVFLSGAIAFLGNQLGRFIGKKRLSIFKLRPRYTSMLFTIATGMLISLLTITFSAILSYNVRIALFGIEKLQKEKLDLENKINQLVNIAKLGEVVFSVNEPIILSVIPKFQSINKIKEDLTNLLSQANQIAISRNNQLAVSKKINLFPPNHHFIIYIKEDYDLVLRELARTKNNKAIMIYSLGNTFLGDENVIVRFRIFDNNLIFKKDELITSLKINANKPKNEILPELILLLQQLQFIAERKGMMRNPITNNFGGSLSAVALLNKAEEIKNLGGWTKVSIIANKNIYIVDSLSVDLEVFPSSP
ncbi:MAG: DUF3084 domain-containing protein [Armatimonadetes bacterium]|nr:DUF3084 domain-containing protein [Armatimonadota bacterium]